jgi:hypothetical protein
MRPGGAQRWLLATAMPTGAAVPSVAPMSEKELSALLNLADWHGVLPAVAMNLRQAAGKIPAENIVFAASIEEARRILSAQLDLATEKLVKRVAVSMLLRRQLAEILPAFAQKHVPVMILKGPEFAARLYPDASLRTFNDLDLLVYQKNLAPAGEAMKSLGYREQPTAMKYDAGYGEQSWRRETGGGLVEIHWNLVNSPTLRAGVSVGLDDLPCEVDSSGLSHPTPASILLIAAVHAAASHGFDRLQPLVDICLCAQGAAGEIDEEEIQKVARATGAEKSLSASLRLAGKIFNNSACMELRQRLNLLAPGLLWKIAVTPAVVLRSHSPRDSFRRQYLRHWLKKREP